MTPIEIALAAVSLVALALGAYAALRRRNHVEADLRAQLDQALEENKRLLALNAKQAEDLHHALVKARGPEKLREHAVLGLEYARTRELTGAALRKAAVAASIRSDRDANGQQDWTDAQHGMAVDAEISRAAAAATR